MIVSQHFVRVWPHIIIPKQSHISPRIFEILLGKSKLARDRSKNKWTFQILFIINPFDSLGEVSNDYLKAICRAGNRIDVVTSGSGISPVSKSDRFSILVICIYPCELHCAIVMISKFFQIIPHHLTELAHWLYEYNEPWLACKQSSCFWVHYLLVVLLSS